MTHAKLLEIANQRLHTRRQIFVEALSFKEQDGAVLLTLDKSAVWIDEGLPENYLFPALMASPKARISKTGSTYVVVPFEHGPGHGPTNTTSYNMDLVNAVKDEMKKKKIPWSTIKKDDQGRPVIGKIAALKVNTPVKTHEGPGMGHGNIGDPRQGRTNIPFLQGAAVYQTQEGEKVKRSVVTFRTASSDRPDNFTHPGLDATNIMESAWEWALNTLENEILPKLFDKYL